MVPQEKGVEPQGLILHPNDRRVDGPDSAVRRHGVDVVNEQAFLSKNHHGFINLVFYESIVNGTGKDLKGHLSFVLIRPS